MIGKNGLFGAFNHNYNTLVCAPTGSGKTLPAEYAIKYFNDKGKKVIYTSPIKGFIKSKIS